METRTIRAHPLLIQEETVSGYQPQLANKFIHMAEFVAEQLEKHTLLIVIREDGLSFDLLGKHVEIELPKNIIDTDHRMNSVLDELNIQMFTLNHLGTL